MKKCSNHHQLAIDTVAYRKLWGLLSGKKGRLANIKKDASTKLRPLLTNSERLKQKLIGNTFLGMQFIVF